MSREKMALVDEYNYDDWTRNTNIKKQAHLFPWGKQWGFPIHNLKLGVLTLFVFIS